MRVDFFITNDSFKFAELTFTPGAGMIPINPIEYDIEWGKNLNYLSMIINMEGCKNSEESFNSRAFWR